MREDLTTFFATDLTPTNPCTTRAPSGTTGGSGERNRYRKRHAERSEARDGGQRARCVTILHRNRCSNEKTVRRIHHGVRRATGVSARDVSRSSIETVAAMKKRCDGFITMKRSRPSAERVVDQLGRGVFQWLVRIDAPGQGLTRSSVRTRVSRRYSPPHRSVAT